MRKRARRRQSATKLSQEGPLSQRRSLFGRQLPKRRTERPLPGLNTEHLAYAIVIMAQTRRPETGMNKMDLNQRPNRKRLALLGVSLLPIGILLVVTFITEPPFSFTRPADPTLTGGPRAAVAIRDKADPYLQWVTMLFALPALRRGYENVYYFTERSKEDKRIHFIKTLRTALRRNESVDLFLLAHGTERYLGWIRSHIKQEEVARLRFVYNTGCGSVKQGPKWRKLGVTTYIGHGGGVSISPVFFFFFLRRWVRGVNLAQSAHDANWYTRGHLLLTGRLSLGLLNGPAMWSHTRAVVFGANRLQINTPLGELMLASSTFTGAGQAQPEAKRALSVTPTTAGTHLHAPSYPHIRPALHQAPLTPTKTAPIDPEVESAACLHSLSSMFFSMSYMADNQCQRPLSRSRRRGTSAPLGGE